jgi:hypothetical protein
MADQKPAVPEKPTLDQFMADAKKWFDYFSGYHLNRQSWEDTEKEFKLVYSSIETMDDDQWAVYCEERKKAWEEHQAAFLSNIDISIKSAKKREADKVKALKRGNPRGKKK